MSKGMMGVDWEERIDFDRMRRERLQKAKKVLAESEADVLFVFRTEDARYLTGFRTHMHPSTQLGNATVVLAKGGEPFLFSMDHEHCKARMPWLTPKQIKPRANFREAVGIQLFADMVKEELGDLVAFVKSIPLRPNRFRRKDGELTAQQERGKAIFERTRTKNGAPIDDTNQCFVCHSGPHYTNQQLADVGTGKLTDRSPQVDVPQLTNVALCAPYLHDGSARTLEEIWTVFNPHDTHGVTNDLSKDELNDLIEYLKTL